jgi:arabinan endo-1,5-alpha-L-arabinosidase
VRAAARAAALGLALGGLAGAGCARPGRPAGPAPAGGPVAQAPAAQRAGTYANPVLDADFPDPTVLRASDGFYYAYATQTEVRRPDGPAATVNVQVARSRDLVRWDRLGDALPAKPRWASRTQDFWAPHVSEHAGRYYLYYSAKPDTALRDTTQGLCLAVATAASPAGPFADVGRPLECGPGFVNIDPMQFDDPRTGAPLLYWGSGFGPIKVRPLAPDRVSFAPGSRATPLVDVERTGDTTRYQRLVEGAWVVYRAPWYYLYYSGDNCCGPRAHYAVMVARSRSATGPFETLAQATGRPQSVILERSPAWNAPGHNSVVRDARGDDWIVYHAVDPRRPRGAADADPNTRRVLLMDRLVYRDGWPAVEGGRPSDGPRPAPAVP